MARKTIQAAGGIVVRGGARPRVAVVQRSKDELWVLPRGKLKRDERAMTGARRERRPPRRSRGGGHPARRALARRAPANRTPASAVCVAAKSDRALANPAPPRAPNAAPCCDACSRDLGRETRDARLGACDEGACAPPPQLSLEYCGNLIGTPAQ